METNTSKMPIVRVGDCGRGGDDSSVDRSGLDDSDS